MRLAAHSEGRVRVVHVPKTIDNDLDLPHYVDTFGFQTARHHGVEIIKNLMVDAKTTSRWYFVVTMGRKAGHLALGIGKAAGATVTLKNESYNARIEPGGSVMVGFNVTTSTAVNPSPTLVTVLRSATAWTWARVIVLRWTSGAP